MLLRIFDNKSHIREQAVLALVRLQDTHSNDCPVVKTFLNAIVDSSAKVRKAVIKNIVVNMTTMPKIIERTRDSDGEVREAAIYRCSDHPEYIRVAEKQTLLCHGFQEQNTEAKKVFTEVLLEKWLNHYDSDILKFLRGIKLDADLNDFKKSMQLFEKVLDVFFQTVPFQDLRALLLLNEDKCIPLSKLTIENVIYWRCLREFIVNSDMPEKDEMLEELFPGLSTFCNYIQEYQKKLSTLKDIWDKMEFEQILHELFYMLSEYDFSDEVGRQLLIKLLGDTFRLNYNFENNVHMELVNMWYKLEKNCIKVCEAGMEVINNIREVEVEVPKVLNKEKEEELNFQLAQLRFKLNEIEQELDDAISQQNWNLASSVQQKMNEHKELISKLESNKAESEATQTVKEIASDPEIIARCLDIIIALLSYPALRKMNPVMLTLKHEFVDKYSEERNTEIYMRVFKCQVLLSILDMDMAKNYLKNIITPVCCLNFLFL